MQTFLLEQYRALREAAGVRERAEIALIGVAGKDRLTYLHAMLTNDIARLKPGEACYSAYLTPQGRMIADMHVLELGDMALVELDRDRKSEVFDKLEQFIFSEDVQLHDLTDALADISVVGPHAPDIISEVLRSPNVRKSEGPKVEPNDSRTSERGPSSDVLRGLEDLHAVRCTFDGVSAVVLFTSVLGVPAFSTYVERSHSARFVDSAIGAGAAVVELPAAEVLRVEAGVPRFGADMDEHTIPLEAGIEPRAISFTKGCYPGQEVITRVLHRGHGRVAKKLVGILVEGETVPERDDRVMADEKEVGRVTSAAVSPMLGAPIALAYAAREFTSPATELLIAHGNERLHARVAELPFVR